MALTPNEELKLLIKEYRELTGRNIKFDTSSLSNVVSAIQLIKDNINASKKSVAELVDNFDATLSTLVAAKEELVNIDKTIRQSLRPEFNDLGKTILNIRNTQKELLSGFTNQTKIQRQLNNLIGIRANIEAQSRGLNNRVIQDLLITTEQTQLLAEEQLRIAQYSEESTNNLGKFVLLMSKIPLAGRYISKPFKDLGDEIIKNTTKLQAFKMQQNVARGLANQISNGNAKTDKQILAGFGGKEARDMLREANEELANLSSTAGIVFSQIGKLFNVENLAILTLYAAVKATIGAFKDLDDESTQLARSLVTSRENALKLRESLNSIAAESYLNTAELTKAQVEFIKLTGIILHLNKQQLESLATATEFTKLSEGALKGLISFSVTSGKSLSESKQLILGTSLITQVQNGLLMDQKEILEEVLQTSAGLRISFKNNAEEITKAVVEAKRLGFALKDMEGIQQNLLNFESSIVAELDAELLLNRELNLEKARYFAQQNMIPELMREINKEGMTLTEWNNVGFLQQESFAKALGMSRERYSEILLLNEQNNNIAASLQGRQEIANKLKEAEIELSNQGLAAALTKGILTKDELKSLGLAEDNLISQISLSDKFNRSIENLKEIWVSMVDGPVGVFFNGFEKVLDTINKTPWIKTATGWMMGVGVVTAAGVMAAAMVNLATKGTMSNPMWVKDISAALGGVGSKVGKYGGMALKGGLAAGTGIVGGSILGGGGSGATIGSMLGTGLGALGFLAGPLGGYAGMAAGGMLGGYLGGQFDTPEENISTSPPINQAVTPFASGGIVTTPTKALIGEAGREAVIPLDQFYAKLDQLVAAVDNVRKAVSEDKNLVVDGSAFATVAARTTERFSFK